jgi:hypothetical protein
MKYISLAVLSLIFGLTSAQSFPDKQAIPNIITPVTLHQDTTTVRLSDLFITSAQIDSLSFSKGLAYKWNKKEGTVYITAKADIAPLAEMKLWIKGAPYSILLRTAKKADAAVRPAVATSKLGPVSFTISIKYQNPGFSFVVYWQNFRLGHDYIKPVGDEMLISIPDEARDMKRSYMRIFCSDTFNAGNDILLPLQNGAVIRDPSLLTQADTQSYISRYIPVRKFDELGSSFDYSLSMEARTVFAISDIIIPFDILGTTLLKSLDAHGSHYTRGHVIGPDELPSFISHRPSNILMIDYPYSDSPYGAYAMFIAFNTAIPGIPVIYYGDTTLADHKVTTDSLSSAQKKLNETVEKLFALRASHMALMYGETQVYAKGDIMIIQRNYFSERIVFVFNKSNKAQTIETGSDIGGYVPKFGHRGTGTKVDLPPLSFELFVGRRM